MRSVMTLPDITVWSAPAASSSSSPLAGSRPEAQRSMPPPTWQKSWRRPSDARHCAACHASGAADAPVTHDPVDWDYRLRRGMEPLVQSAIRGRIAMPPRGRCWDCTDEQIRALVEFMAAPR